MCQYLLLVVNKGVRRHQVRMSTREVEIEEFSLGYPALTVV